MLPPLLPPLVRGLLLRRGPAQRFPLRGATPSSSLGPLGRALLRLNPLSHAGGSPVQADLIYTLIRRLSKSSGIPVFTFAEDVAASGGYWLM